MTTLIDRRGPSRRALLTGLGAAGALMVSGAAVLNPREAWGLEVTALKPETMRTLIVMARDVYPHDRIPDRFYAIAMKPYETGAATDAALKTLVEEGVITLDTLAKAKHGVAYADVGWEDQRVALLRQIEDGAFFQKVRGGLVVGLYNQEDVWPIFGYEGSSADKGGYIDRGFNDLAWL
ncbi:twin-arginine translocation signal domain-containing protein [Ancylobacter radicis]|uniref:Twin-arginine translocation signal domain-containing protein n=1 Tax=Ancylobacter radicis TaxID=2836179 RepID=A0ABS5R9A9_9HYPH|nr:twin-arginine translocation signal domain-containing protein [Ancylobacter radicis]MBS9478251.1 twin-arginine translocation signal domain-containing protein [Ancylobacter radicis]